MFCFDRKGRSRPSCDQRTRWTRVPVQQSLCNRNNSTRPDWSTINILFINVHRRKVSFVHSSSLKNLWNEKFVDLSQVTFHLVPEYWREDRHLSTRYLQHWHSHQHYQGGLNTVTVIKGPVCFNSELQLSIYLAGVSAPSFIKSRSIQAAPQQHPTARYTVGCDESLIP